MAKPLSAEDVFPLVDSLSPRERLRLLRLISVRPTADDAEAYRELPAGNGEFTNDEEPLAWESEGWEDIS
jgi:hypothetical protein